MSILHLFNNYNIIAAHRGASSLAPENTMKALKMSIGNFDLIEIDVQLSSDGVAIIFHDETLERTTNLTKNKMVSELNFEELNKLDYGSWFNGIYEPLLTLENALEFVKDNNLFVNIEIKDIHNVFNDETVVSKVIDIIKKFDLQTNVLISSFRAEYLPLSKTIEPNIATALLVDKQHPKNLIDYLNELRVDGYHMNKKLADQKTVEKLKQNGFFVSVYTVDEKREMKELFNIGVNCIFSNTNLKN